MNMSEQQPRCQYGKEQHRCFASCNKNASTESNHSWVLANIKGIFFFNLILNNSNSICYNRLLCKIIAKLYLQTQKRTILVTVI